MTRRHIGLLIGLWLWALPVSAQVLGPYAITAQDAGNCATAHACAVFQVGNAPALTMQVTGTFSGTLTFEGTSNGFTWDTISVTKLSDASGVTTTTTTGSFAVANSGLLGWRLRAGTLASGGANVTATRGSILTGFSAYGISSVNGQFQIDQNSFPSTTIPIVLIRANNQVPYALYIQNKTFSTTANVGLGLGVLDDGTGYIDTFGVGPGTPLSVTSGQALALSSGTGDITLSAGTGGDISLTSSQRVNLTSSAGFGVNITSDGTGNFNSNVVTGFDFRANGTNGASITDTGFIARSGAWFEGGEITAPANPGTDLYRIYGKDSGGGKTKLCVIFHTGAEQCFATEP